jgi:acetyl/propionyl-CoA carboxylase alpha subunit
LEARVILEIDCNGVRQTVEIKGPGSCLIGGKEISCDWMRLPDGAYSIILDGRVHDLSVDFDGSFCHVTDRSGTHSLNLSDPKRPPGANPAPGGQSGIQRICAEMPGKVIRLLAACGETIVYDQGLLVLEAMKMQNEIRSPKAGAVREIGVQPGQTVKSGDFLIAIE